MRIYLLKNEYDVNGIKSTNIINLFTNFKEAKQAMLSEIANDILYAEDSERTEITNTWAKSDIEYRDDWSDYEIENFEIKEQSIEQLKMEIHNASLSNDYYNLAKVNEKLNITNALYIASNVSFELSSQDLDYKPENFNKICDVVNSLWVYEDIAIDYAAKLVVNYIIDNKIKENDFDNIETISILQYMECDC